MIRLTYQTTNEPLWITPEQIELINAQKGGSGIYLHGTDDNSAPIKVIEPPEEVARKVLEYRLAIIDFQVDVEGAGAWARKQLEKLAGLEETNHD